ncbi:hypothetical protein EH223_00640 [candidate division KSB1 bacterium]|nr:metal-dependent hydrolase [candidate division KSB1 bacterium]RQW07158.1 MAG: hypothetical protein EH223_00640 [candidate division KSB1 bacterium]
MPDLVTHTATAYFLMRSDSFQRFRVFFYLGAILPDILARPIHIMFPQFYLYTIAIHTPLFMILFTLLFAEFFQTFRLHVIKYLLFGILSHFFLDLFQKHITDGYYWFFPFSWRSFEIGLFWPELPVRLVPVWILLVAATEITLRLKRRFTRISS